MNIQQLNNSGQSIQTFFVTAVVILLLTGGTWLCIEEINEYRSWSQKNGPRALRSKGLLARPTYNIAMRARMLVWLICNGYWTWAWKTKAWRYILANSRPTHESAFDPVDSLRNSSKPLSAGDYVSKYMCSSDASRAFSLD